MTERTYWQHPEGAVMWTVDGRPPSRFDRAGAWLVRVPSEGVQ